MKCFWVLLKSFFLFILGKFYLHPWDLANVYQIQDFSKQTNLAPKTNLVPKIVDKK